MSRRGVPMKIQMIKELRETTGLGLGEAKAVVDWLCRGGGPINRLIEDVRADLEEIAYMGVPFAPGPFISTASPVSSPEEDKSLTARVEAIERWIQNS